ncbi:MAG: hypothetical protein J0H09_15405 [Burkholderiales bacterium]|nr:hypothetical protein [Burkholderiales bacterium]
MPVPTFSMRVRHAFAALTATAAAIGFVALTAVLPPPATAQIVRPIPPSAELGKLEILSFPQARINDVPVLLSAGTRIYDRNNLITTPASVSGAQAVLFERDMNGLIGRVWILTDSELAAAQARLKTSPITGGGSGSGASAADAAAGIATQQ